MDDRQSLLVRNDCCCRRLCCCCLGDTCSGNAFSITVSNVPPSCSIWMARWNNAFKSEPMLLFNDVADVWRRDAFCCFGDDEDDDDALLLFDDDGGIPVNVVLLRGLILSLRDDGTRSSSVLDSCCRRRGRCCACDGDEPDSVDDADCDRPGAARDSLVAVVAVRPIGDDDDDEAAAICCSTDALLLDRGGSKDAPDDMDPVDSVEVLDSMRLSMRKVRELR
mmetsp:Transcript_9263/g.26469  ORF Transcript_9263/g.26469 Transcript_9263/m.26469 type:complete len:222 (+) Transcript_9263:967-1632(+)